MERGVPVKKYRGITLRRKVVERLEQIAVKTKRTVPGVIEHMLDMQYPRVGPHGVDFIRQEISHVERE